MNSDHIETLTSLRQCLTFNIEKKYNLKLFNPQLYN